MRTSQSPFMVVVVASTLAALSTPALAQPKQKPIVPLKVQIVVSRYDGEKKVSSLPYTLAVNANDGEFDGPMRFIPQQQGVARLRTGANVPVPSIASPKESPKDGPVGPVVYKTIGINIDCSANSLDDGRFRVDISIEDTSVYSDGQTAQGVPKLADIPSFRTFQSTNAVILRDGQSSQFTAAADRITGEVTKVDVTVTVVK